VVAHVGADVDVGVNVYVVDTVLLIAGDQLPAIPLFEVVGNALIAAPKQIGVTWVNVGVVDGFTVTIIAEDVAEQLLLFVTTTV
jgi:hypothetical protein